jgi:hypothetical protein
MLVSLGDGQSMLCKVNAKGVREPVPRPEVPIPTEEGVSKFGV